MITSVRDLRLAPDEVEAFVEAVRRDRHSPPILERQGFKRSRRSHFTSTRLSDRPEARRSRRAYERFLAGEPL